MPHRRQQIGKIDIANNTVFQEEIEKQFGNGRRFIDLHEATKAPTKFVPDLFMGWRGRQDTNAAVGKVKLDVFAQAACVQQVVALKGPYIDRCLLLYTCCLMCI